MINPFQTLTNHFLIAMPTLMEPQFRHAVIFICEHTENGAVGIVINRPFEHVRLRDIFQQVNIESSIEAVNDGPVLFGGPIQQERGFVLHTADYLSASDSPAIPTWQSSLQVGNRICVT